MTDLEIIGNLLHDNADECNTRYGMLTPDELDVLLALVQRLARESVA